MECFNVNNNSSDSNLLEGPVSKIDICKVCGGRVHFEGKYPVPHISGGKEINCREFALHEDQCELKTIDVGLGIINVAGKGFRYIDCNKCGTSFISNLEGPKTCITCVIMTNTIKDECKKE